MCSIRSPMNSSMPVYSARRGALRRRDVIGEELHHFQLLTRLVMFMLHHRDRSGGLRPHALFDQREQDLFLFIM